MDDNHQALVNAANEAVQAVSDSVSRNPYRLQYHISAPAGWVNDPNGVCYFQGEYHVFYQHYPFKPENGPKYWGHVKSKDLVHWEHLPIAIAPSVWYDVAGCWSGSAVDDNGVLTLIYSGHVEENGVGRQVQCIATSRDGIHFDKYAGNPVVPMHPADGSNDFRDPKVIRHDDTWYMIVGTRDDERGKVVLYSSPDLKSWTYVGVTAESDGSQGTMWECPDLFSLGGKDVLIISPIGMEGHKNIYIVGRMDYNTGHFHQESFGELDLGLDFYAAQTLQAPDGRRILFAWMNMWQTPMPTEQYGWAGDLTIPRELTLLPDGVVASQPVRELESLRVKSVISDHLLVIDGEYQVSELVWPTLELKLVVNLDQSTCSVFGMRLRCSADFSEQTVIQFDVRTQELLFDKRRSGVGDNGINLANLAPVDGRLKLHVFLDKSSVELFANDGRLAISNRIYPDENSLGLAVFADDGALHVEEFSVWELGSGFVSQG